MDPDVIEVRPIGYVRNNIPEAEVPRRRAEMISEIVIDEHWLEGLTGVEAYSHLFVVFWMHKEGTHPVELLLHPRGDESLPLTGILATRARNRPNPIGLAVVELLKRNRNRLTVRSLDAYDGTPVLDLKPYDDYDAVASIKVPEWWAKRCRKK